MKYKLEILVLLVILGVFYIYFYTSYPFPLKIGALLLLCTTGLLYSIFSSYPFHKKRLESATDDLEISQIKGTIGITVMRIFVFAMGIIFSVYMLFSKDY